MEVNINRPPKQIVPVNTLKPGQPFVWCGALYVCAHGHNAPGSVRAISMYEARDAVFAHDCAVEIPKRVTVEVDL